MIDENGETTIEEVESEPSLYQLDYARLGTTVLWPVCQDQNRRIQALEAAVLELVDQVKALEAGA